MYFRAPFLTDQFELQGALEIHLDARPLRHPTTRAVIRLPTSKPLLAHALAVEWDQLTSASQATKQHMIPLTSLVCRALDIAADPASTKPALIATVLRYLDTDSLLCWSAPGGEQRDSDGRTLRQLQEAAAAETIAPLARRVWPGVTLRPAFDDGDGSSSGSSSIVPRPQDPDTRDVIRGWLLSLTPFELAALERATLAGKSLLAAARLVTAWSEDRDYYYRRDDGDVVVAAPTEGSGEEGGAEKRFGVEEAARAVSIEVDWQTGRWGEVEDTHDVEKEDLRRQLGSAVLLVSGTGSGKGKKGESS